MAATGGKKSVGMPPLNPAQGGVKFKSLLERRGLFMNRNCGSVGSLLATPTKLKAPSSMSNPKSATTTASKATPPENKADIEISSQNIGDSVVISGIQTGILKYFGETQFKPGLWCGIQLPSADGKHDGSVSGVRYFKCPPNHGIFAPLEKVSLMPKTVKVVDRRQSLGSFDVKGQKSVPVKRPNGTKLAICKSFKGELLGEGKRRKIEVEEKSNAAKYKKSLGSVLPNFSQINKMNLRDEMQRSIESESENDVHQQTLENSPFLPSDSSTPSSLLVASMSTSTTTVPRDPYTNPLLQIRCLSESKSTSEDNNTNNRERRPSVLSLSSSSSSSNVTGLFGQLTPDLLDNASFPNSPEDRGISDESSLRLTTPSTSLLEWDLGDDESSALYAHLRSPSIDNLELDEDDLEETFVAQQELDLRRSETFIVSKAPSSSDQVDTVSSTQQNIKHNRSARIIDGALYTEDNQREGGEPVMSSSGRSVASEAADSSSSGFYSSSESGSCKGKCSDGEDEPTILNSNSSKSDEFTSSSSSSSEAPTFVASGCGSSSSQASSPGHSTKQKVNLKSLDLAVGQQLGSLRNKKLDIGKKGRSQSVSCLLYNNNNSTRVVVDSGLPVTKPNAPHSSQLPPQRLKALRSTLVATSSVPSSARSASGPKAANKWDSIMAKISEGKGKSINVKDVKPKVFEKLKSGESGQGKMTRTGSTASDVSVGVKLQRSKKEVVGRRVSDLSSASSSSTPSRISTASKKSTVTGANNVNSGAITNGRKNSVPSPGSKSKPTLLPSQKQSNQSQSQSKEKDKAVPTTTKKTVAVAVPLTKEVKKKETTTTGVTNIKSTAKAGSSVPKTILKPLRDQNRINTKPAVVKECNNNVASRPRRDRDLEDENAKLKEQLASLLLRLSEKDEDVAAVVKSSRDARAELETQVVALALVLQKFYQESDGWRERAQKKEAEFVDLALKLENSSKLVTKLREELETVTEASKANTSSHNLELEENREELENLRLELEDRLSDLGRTHREEVERLQEAHRTELEALEKAQRAKNINANPHDILVKELESMGHVIDMKSATIKELQIRVQTLKLKEEEQIQTESQVRSLSARVEDLEALLEQSKGEKGVLSAKLAESEDALADALSRISLLSHTVDELKFKIKNPGLVPVSPSALNFAKKELTPNPGNS